MRLLSDLRGVLLICLLGMVSGCSITYGTLSYIEGPQASKTKLADIRLGEFLDRREDQTPEVCSIYWTGMPIKQFVLQEPIESVTKKVFKQAAIARAQLTDVAPAAFNVEIEDLQCRYSVRHMYAKVVLYLELRTTNQVLLKKTYESEKLLRTGSEGPFGEPPRGESPLFASAADLRNLLQLALSDAIDRILSDIDVYFALRSAS